MQRYKGYTIYGLASLAGRNQSCAWRPCGMVFAPDREGIEVVTDSAFATKEQAEQHGLELCKLWIDKPTSEHEANSALTCVWYLKNGRWLKKKERFPAGLSHTWEKFYLAVDELATGPGDVRSRLEKAYFHLHVLLLREIPSDLRRDYKWIIRMLTRRQARWESETDLEASLRQMRNSTGVKIAKRIVRLKNALNDRKQEESYKAKAKFGDKTRTGRRAQRSVSDLPKLSIF